VNFGAFLVFCLVLGIWSVLLVYGVPYSLENRDSRRKDLAELARIDDRLHEYDQTLRSGNLDPKEKRDLQTKRESLNRQKNEIDHRLPGYLAELIVSLAINIGFFLLGIFMLGSVLPAWKIFALLASLAAFGLTIWVWRRYRQRRSEWRIRAPRGRRAEGGHARIVALYLASLLALPVIGVVLLISIF
jgi:Flp pilus assembly protein TadB